MFDYLIVAACVLYAALLFIPLHFMSPGTKARYLPVPFIAVAIGVPVLVIWGMGLSPLFYAVILLMLVNVRVLIRQLRVCPECGAISGLERGARELHHCPVLLESALDRSEPSAVEAPAAPSVGVPPRGYEVETAPNGDLILHYRTTGMGCMASFFALFIVSWTVGCIVGTRSLLEKNATESYVIIALLWLANAWMIGFSAWHFFSRWRLVFSKESLAATRSLGPIVRRRNFARGEIRIVRQVQDGGNSGVPADAGGGVQVCPGPRHGHGDSFSSWAIIVNAPEAVAIINRQGREQAAWLGRFISDWSGAPLEDLGPAGDLQYKRL